MPFLGGLPDDPQLEPLVAAFQAGNYALLRQRATALLANADLPEQTRQAAKELVRRTEPDPLIRPLLGLALLLLLLVAWFCYATSSH